MATIRTVASIQQARVHSIVWGSGSLSMKFYIFDQIELCIGHCAPLASSACLSNVTSFETLEFTSFINGHLTHDP